jgi:hypothetical protein
VLEARKDKTEWSCALAGEAQQTVPDSLHAAILSSNCTLLLSDAALYSCRGFLVQAALYQAVTVGACTVVSQQQSSLPCNTSSSSEPLQQSICILYHCQGC